MAAFSKSDCAAIEAAVSTAEAQSASEFVVAILPRSSSWHLRRARITWLLTCLVGGTLVLLEPRLGLLDFFMGLMGSSLALWWLTGRRPVLRRLLSRRAAERAALRRASEIFSTRRIFDTPFRTGVLIFISELERRVAIVGDRSIDAAMGAAGWQAAVHTITLGLQEGRSLPALLKVIEEVSHTMATALPARDPTAARLPDDVFRGDADDAVDGDDDS